MAGDAQAPDASARYEQMLAVLWSADSLYLESAYSREAEGKKIGGGTYRLWLKKPNFARLEALQDGEVTGVSVLDGERLWSYWTRERPFYTLEDEAAWRETCRNVYVVTPAPPARHSLAHEANWRFFVTCILDPSVFHGLTDPKEPYRDGVRSLGTQQIAGETCDGIEVSFMNGQRLRHLYLSRRNLLPLRSTEIIRVSQEIVSHESWSQVTVDAPMAMNRFAWTPPDGWREWHPPGPEARLLKPGTPAPDFALKGIDGETLRLSDFRGRVVGLAIWRAG